MQGVGTLDDREVDAGVFAGPVDELAGVAAIGEDGADKAPQRARGPQQRSGTVAVLLACRLHLDGEQAPVGIGQDMPLATRDLLARVVAARAPF